MLVDNGASLHALECLLPSVLLMDNNQVKGWIGAVGGVAIRQRRIPQKGGDHRVIKINATIHHVGPLGKDIPIFVVIRIAGGVFYVFLQHGYAVQLGGVGKINRSGCIGIECFKVDRGNAGTDGFCNIGKNLQLVGNLQKPSISWFPARRPAAYG